MISKELLSEVIEDYVFGVEVVDTEVRWLPFSDCDGHLEINIHELAHKCKIKALEWGYCVINTSEYIRIYCNDFEVFFERVLEPFSPVDDIKACQWILDNKD